MSRFLYVLTALCLAIVLVSCGKNNPIVPQISSLEQLLFNEEKLPADGGQFIYRQGIQVNNPAEGNLYSYRVRTYANELPAGFYADEEGWLFFRTNGTDSAIPLSQPGTHRSIWTSQSYISADFASVDGKISNLITAVEVRSKSADGDIRQYSSAFKSNRIIGSQVVVPFENGGQTGKGIEFELQEQIGDILVDGLYAHHFMYRINILDSDLQLLSNGTWYSSLEMQDIRRVRLNGTTEPALSANVTNQFTQFESYVVSRKGIEEATHQSVYFIVAGGYKPVAKIYPWTLVGLGQYHYGVISDEYIAAHEVIPSSVQGQTNRYLWPTTTGYEAVNSPDFKLHIRWGHAGLYGRAGGENNIYYLDDPWQIELNDCVDEDDFNYGSRVEYYDLRFDGELFPVQSYFVNPLVVIHTNGQSWLRVRNINDAARHHTFSNLSNGIHEMSVCAVDLQGVISDPVNVRINLVQYKPLSQRSGILIVDDSRNNGAYSPDTIVDNFYNSVVPNNFGSVDDFQVEMDNGSSATPSPVLMQNYKAVIWHSDNPVASGNLIFSADILELYLAQGGNLIISGTRDLVNAFNKFERSNSLFSNRLGLNSTTNYTATLANEYFFVEAIGQAGMNNIPVNLSDPFNPNVNIRQGLWYLLYFHANTGLDYLYQFGCKTVDASVYPPTQEQYDLYSSKYVAYKHSSPTGNVAVFGFPLSYMEQTEVASALQNILSEMIGTKVAKGGAQ